MVVPAGPGSVTLKVKLSLTATPWASVAVTVIGWVPKSASVGVPEITPVLLSMARPAGSEAEKARVSPAAGAVKWLDTSREKECPSGAVWLAIAVLAGPGSVTVSVKFSLTATPWASVAVTVTGLAPKSASVGVPEITPLLALIVSPDGSEAEKVRVLPAAGAAKWFDTSSENGWPSGAVWFAIAPSVGPGSLTVSVKLRLTAAPCASVAVTVTVLWPKSESVGVPEITPVAALMARPVGSEAE